MIKTFVLALFAASLAMPVLAQRAGRVDLIEGEVSITDNKSKTRAAQVGEQVNQGDTLATGKTGELHIKLDDGGMLALRPDARLTVVKFQNKGRDSDTSVFSLARGALRAITGWIGRRVPDRVAIETPTATIGIRGTDHEALVIPEGSREGQPGTYDKVNAGGTRLVNAHGVADISPGQAGFASATAAPTVMPSIPDLFKPGRNDGRLEGLNDRLQRSPESRPANPVTGTQTGGGAAPAGKGGGVQLQGNTRINATAKDTNAVAVGQNNEAGNRIGTIGGK
jgi:hypothetical protein